MEELPQELLEGEWPFQNEITLLKRMQQMQQQMEGKIRKITRELRNEHFYPRRTETKQLRLRVYHTFRPPVEDTAEAPGTPGQWALRIEGVDTNAGEHKVVKFSNYFRKATIELDPRLYSDSVINWTSFQKTHHEVDGLEISRAGHTPHTVRIQLLPAHTPERFSISPELAGAIGEYLSASSAYRKQDIIMATWEYIKRRNLIKEDDCRVVVCDDTLTQVFNCVSLPFTSIVVALKPHLTPVHALELEYALSLSTECSSELIDERFFDVDVVEADELEQTRKRILAEWEELQQEQRQEWMMLKQQEVDVVARLHENTRKHEWMTQFAQDPCGFMKDVERSQQGDQQILVAESEADELNIPHAHQFSQPWVREVVSDLLTLTTHFSDRLESLTPMQQSNTRLRCDPTDYARRQQEKKERAKDIRDQRQRGVFSDEHTFTPKVNPHKSRLASPSREEAEQRQSSSQLQSSAVNSFDETPIRPSKSLLASRKEILSPEETVSKRNSIHRSHNNNNDEEGMNGSDALDNLSRRYPKKAPPVPTKLASPTPLEPEHDTLFREVKRTTGKELDDLPIKRSTGPPPGKHTGPCLRNSSCGCPQCSGMSTGSTSMRADPPVRRREPKSAPPVEQDTYASQSTSSRSFPHKSEMENSLSLLKSKMSRRKARSAPSNQASLFVEQNAPSAMVHSARNPSTLPHKNTPPPVAAPRRAAPPAAVTKNPPVRNDNEDNESTYYPPPISNGFKQSEELDEYATGDEEMEQCSSCQRRFNVTVLEKHQKVCAKVFMGQRKVFNMAAKRLEGTEAEKLAKQAKTKGGSGGGGKKTTGAEEQPIKAKTADWKQKSEMFRNAMKASRDVTIALKEGKQLPPPMPSAPDPSLILCDYCGRRFNDKAAERHINFCREKSQRDNIGKGPPKKGATAAPAAKPTRAPVRKK